VCVLEGVSGETQQAIQERLQHLEKELYFYKSTSRQLKKKVRELLSDALHPDNQPSHTQEHRQKLCSNMETRTRAKNSQTNSEEVPTGTHITTTYTKICTEQTDTKTHRDSSTHRLSHQMQCPSSPDCQTLKKTRLSECNQTLRQAHGRSARGQSGETLEMSPVRLCRQELVQISAADLQVSGSATRRQQSIVDTSTESTLEDSIEVSRKKDT